MAQVTSYQRGTFTFTTAQQTAGTAQTVFTNGATPMRVINVGCVMWNNSGNEQKGAMGFFIRHNGSTTNATTAMLNMTTNGNGIGGVELPPGNTTSMKGDAVSQSSNTYPGPGAISFGTQGSADPIGANNSGNWLTSAAWWQVGNSGGRSFNTASNDYFGTIIHSPGGFWMSPSDVLVCKAFIGNGSSGGNICYVAYNFITVTDSGS